MATLHMAAARPDHFAAYNHEAYCPLEEPVPRFEAALLPTQPNWVCGLDTHTVSGVLHGPTVLAGYAGLFALLRSLTCDPQGKIATTAVSSIRFGPLVRVAATMPGRGPWRVASPGAICTCSTRPLAATARPRWRSARGPTAPRYTRSASRPRAHKEAIYIYVYLSIYINRNISIFIYPDTPQHTHTPTRVCARPGLTQTLRLLGSPLSTRVRTHTRTHTRARAYSHTHAARASHIHTYTEGDTGHGYRCGIILSPSKTNIWPLSVQRAG